MNRRFKTLFPALLFRIAHPLIKTTNKCFAKPLVLTRKEAVLSRGGGKRITKRVTIVADLSSALLPTLHDLHGQILEVTPWSDVRCGKLRRVHHVAGEKARHLHDPDPVEQSTAPPFGA